MNLSKTDFIPKTKDGHVVKRGDILYWVGHGTIKEFEAWSWHNGKDTKYPRVGRSYLKNYVVDVSGYGGRGVYPKLEDNPYGFMLLSECFKDLDKAKKFLIDHYKKNIKRIQDLKPKRITKKF